VATDAGGNAAGAGGGLTALTAVLHDPDSLPRFRLT
jgi:hypothetical protein